MDLGQLVCTIFEMVGLPVHGVRRKVAKAKARARASIAGFAKAELELGSTYCFLAHSSMDEAKRERLRKKAYQALDEVMRIANNFQLRFDRGFHLKAAALKRALKI